MLSDDTAAILLDPDSHACLSAVLFLLFGNSGNFFSFEFLAGIVRRPVQEPVKFSLTGLTGPDWVSHVGSENLVQIVNGGSNISRI
jgi:hypothetical protein